MLCAAETTTHEAGAPRTRFTCNKYNTASRATYGRMGLMRTADIVTDIGSGFAMDDM